MTTKEKTAKEEPQDGQVSPSELEEVAEGIPEPEAPDLIESQLEDGEGGFGTEVLYRELMSSKNIDMKTDLPEAAIPQVVELSSLASKYESKELKTRLYHYFRLRLSKNRMSRKEISDIVRAAREEQLTRDARDLPT